MKKGLEGGLTPIQLGAFRIIFAFAGILVIGVKNIFLIKKRHLKYITLAGLLGNFLPIFLFAFAQTQISSSISSTLNSFTSLNTLIIGYFFFGLTFTKQNIIGVLLGVIGCLFLVYSGASANPTKNYLFALLVVLATWCYAININFVKKYLSDVPPIAITLGGFLVYIFPAIIVLFLSEYHFDNSFKHINTLFYVFVLGVVGTGIANVYFYKLIQSSSPLFASNVTYLIPIVAIFWSYIDNEMLSIHQVGATLIILLGVYLSNKK